MRNKKLLAIFCMVLILSIPFVIAQEVGNTFGSSSSGFDLGRENSAPVSGAQSFSTPSTALEAGYVEGEVGFFNQPTSLLDRLSAGFSTTFGNPQDVGEALVVNVRSIEPAFVRASLLEQQDTPVFVQLQGSDIGSLFNQDRDPLTGLTSVPPIRSMVVRQNRTSPYVKSVRYIPPKNNEFSKNNLGILVIVLNRLRNETALPDARAPEIEVFNQTVPRDIVSERLIGETPVISLDLTAEILFDLASGGLLGLGEETLSLRVEPEDQFLQKPGKDANGFFGDRAYVRVQDLSSTSATIQIYNRQLLPLSLFQPVNTGGAGAPIRTITLREGQYSSPIRLGISSNPIEDSVIFKLEDVLVPGDRASYQIVANGKTFTRKANVGSSIFSGSNYQVERVDVKTDPVDFAEITRDFSFDAVTLERIKAADQSALRKLTYTMVLRNAVTRETKVLTRTTVTLEGAALDIVPISRESAQFLESKYCPPVVSGIEQDVACEAVESFKQLIVDHPTSSQATDALQQLSEIYQKKLIDVEACDLRSETSVVDPLACKEFEADMNALAFFYANELADARPEVLESVREGFGAVGGYEFLLSEGVGIQLLNTQKADQVDQGTVVMRIGNEDRTFTLSPTGKVITTGVDAAGNSYEWVLTRINSNSVSVAQRKGQRTVTRDGRSETVDNLVNERALPLGSHRLVVREGERGEALDFITLDIREIRTNSEALISVIPGSGQGLSRSSFRVHIPVEPRPFKFTPEQLQSQIEVTRALIEKLDNIIDKLDAVVRTWKKICLVTFAFVTLKSSFLGGTARTLARRSVANVYKQQCSLDTAAGQFKSIDECLAARGDEIASDVDANERAIELVNSQLDGETPQTLGDCGGVPFQEAQALGATIDDCREYLRLNALNEDSGVSQTLKESIQPNLNALNFEQKKGQLEEAEGWFQSQLSENERQELLQKAGAITGDEEKIQQAKLKILQQRVRRVESEKSLLNRQGTLLPVQDIIFDPADPNKGTIFTPQLDTQTGQTIQGKDLKDVQRITSLQYAVFQSGPAKVLADAQAKCSARREGSTCVEREISALDTPAPENIYVEPGFQRSSTGVFGVDAPLNKFNLLIHDDEAITQSDLPPANVNFRLYDSQVTNVADQIRSTTYAYGELTAEYDPDTGYVYCFPTGENGEYILVLDRASNGPVKENGFRVMNVGANGVMECTGGGDDVITQTESALFVNPQLKTKYLSVLNQVRRCQNDGDVAGNVIVSGRPVPVRCSSQQSKLNIDLNGPKCIDVMEPGDCTLLFNACDPVMCPASRCNLGGRYRVDDVIQSGLVGSVVLCAPNVKQGVVVPVCLTGILAGLRNIRSILQGYADCLELSLEQGQNVGFCDYIRSVGICELVWREVINIFNVRGPVVDYLSEQAFGEPEGGAEYLTFQSSLNNVGDSFDYFTSEYDNTYVAALRGQSTGELGTQVCRLGVYGKLPSVGEILDKLSEPEDPPQFTAFYDEAPYTQDIDVSQAAGLTRGVTQGAQQLSNYKVFYHIYAGTGFVTQQQVFGEPLSPGTNQPASDVTFSVFLRSTQLGLPPLYMTTTEPTQRTAVIPRNQYAQQTIQRVAQTGYNEICVNINGKEECGFGKVSSAFALNYLNDQLVEAEAEKTDITSAEECVPNAPNTGAALGSLTTPENLGVFNTGIVRVCNPTPPTADVSRWQNVGSCEDQGTCWLDRNSINIKDVEARNELFTRFRQTGDIPADQDLEFLDAEEANAKLQQLNKDRNSIIEKLRTIIQ